MFSTFSLKNVHHTKTLLSVANLGSACQILILSSQIVINQILKGELDIKFFLHMQFYLLSV